MSRHASYPENAREIDREWIDSLPIADGSFVQGVTIVLSYVHPDGTNRYVIREHNDIPVAHAVGLLHMAIAEITHRIVG